MFQALGLEEVFGAPAAAPASANGVVLDSIEAKARHRAERNMRREAADAELKQALQPAAYGFFPVDIRRLQAAIVDARAAGVAATSLSYAEMRLDEEEVKQSWPTRTKDAANRARTSSRPEDVSSREGGGRRHKTSTISHGGESDETARRGERRRHRTRGDTAESEAATEAGASRDHAEGNGKGERGRHRGHHREAKVAAPSAAAPSAAAPSSEPNGADGADAADKRRRRRRRVSGSSRATALLLGEGSTPASSPRPPRTTPRKPPPSHDGAPSLDALLPQDQLGRHPARWIKQLSQSARFAEPIRRYCAVRIQAAVRGYQAKVLYIAMRKRKTVVMMSGKI